MYPQNFHMCSFSIRSQSSKGGGHELLVKSDIRDTLNEYCCGAESLASHDRPRTCDYSPSSSS